MHFYRKYAHSSTYRGGGHIYGENAYDKIGVGIFTEKNYHKYAPSQKFSYKT